MSQAPGMSDGRKGQITTPQGDALSWSKGCDDRVTRMFDPFLTFNTFFQFKERL
jgi:hypothetical protein